MIKWIGAKCKIKMEKGPRFGDLDSFVGCNLGRVLFVPDGFQDDGGADGHERHGTQDQAPFAGDEDEERIEKYGTEDKAAAGAEGFLFPLLAGIEQSCLVCPQGFGNGGEKVQIRGGITPLPARHGLAGHMEFFCQIRLGHVLLSSQPFDVFRKIRHVYHLPLSIG